jgi:hypothetical protein
MTKAQDFVDTRFRCLACQGSQKPAGIKPLVDSAYGDKSLSKIQTNFIIKAVKDEKLTQNDKKGLLSSWLLSSLPFGRPGGKTVNAAHITKALAMFQAERSRLS